MQSAVQQASDVRQTGVWACRRFWLCVAPAAGVAPIKEHFPISYACFVDSLGQDEKLGGLNMPASLASSFCFCCSFTGPKSKQKVLNCFRLMSCL
jgi:hypothetical protein